MSQDFSPPHPEAVQSETAHSCFLLTGGLGAALQLGGTLTFHSSVIPSASAGGMCGGPGSPSMAAVRPRTELPSGGRPR